MSILKPTPGAVMDRMMIIELKVDAFRKAGKPTQLLNKELDSLAQHLSSHGEDCAKIQDLRALLESANRRLWTAEDAIRSTEEISEVALQAKKICALNDERNRLIREIDKAFGVEPVEEKIYG
jgi:fructose-bisphosphate aldolase class 1